mgnify:CR=1 FL=1
MKVRLILGIGIAVLVLSVAFHLRGNDPETEGSLFPPCSFNKATGLHCPGCGGTRAGHALTNFKIGEAFRKNALLVLLLPFLAVAGAIEGVAWVKGAGYRGPRVRLPGGLSWALLILILGFWILRNIPFWPFELLAPH